MFIVSRTIAYSQAELQVNLADDRKSFIILLDATKELNCIKITQPLNATKELYAACNIFNLKIKRREENALKYQPRLSGLVEFSPNGSLAIVWNRSLLNNQQLRIINASSGILIRNVKINHYVADLEWLPDSKKWVLLCEDSHFKFSLRSLLGSVIGHPVQSCHFSIYLFNSDGEEISKLYLSPEVENGIGIVTLRR